MTQYDNSNSGIAGQPWPEQNFILHGKLSIHQGNIAIEERPVALIKQQSKDGSNRIEVYQKVGVLFENEKDNDNQPDYSGPMEGEYADLKIAGWRGEKNGNRYMSLKVSPKMVDTKPQQEQPTNTGVITNDDIPF